MESTLSGRGGTSFVRMGEYEAMRPGPIAAAKVAL